MSPDRPDRPERRRNGSDPLGRRALFSPSSPSPAAEDDLSPPASPGGDLTSPGGGLAEPASPGDDLAPRTAVRTGGRRAMFSPPPSPDPGPVAPPPPAAALPDASFHGGQPGGRSTQAVVECRRCHERTRLGLFGLVRHLVPSLWVPLVRFNRWMRCPSCNRTSWCRIEWPLDPRR